MYYVSDTDHRKGVMRVHRFYWMILLVVTVLFGASLYLPFQDKFERDVLASVVGTFRSEYLTIKSEYLTIKAKQEMLSLLRTKPLTVSQALDISDAVLEQQHVPVAIVLAVIKQESQFSTGSVSPKGAKGLMQIMPQTWGVFTKADYRQVHDPIHNIDVGVRLLADLHTKYGDWKTVFRAYFAGPENARNRKYDWYATAVMKKVEDFENGH